MNMGAEAPVFYLVQSTSSLEFKSINLSVDYRFSKILRDFSNDQSNITLLLCKLFFKSIIDNIDIFKPFRKNKNIIIIYI